MADQPRYRRPPNAPSATAWDDIVRWKRLADTASARAMASAQTWRTGLAGFVTILTSALILKGSDLGSVSAPLKYAVAGLLAGGAGLAVWGLWTALTAESPPQESARYGEILAEFSSIAGYERSVARSSTAALDRSRRRVFVALVALLVGSALWWLAPPKDDPASHLKVIFADQAEVVTVCGTWLPSPAGELLLQINDTSTPTAVPLSSIQDLAVVNTCDV